MKLNFTVIALGMALSPISLYAAQYSSVDIRTEGSGLTTYQYVIEEGQKGTFITSIFIPDASPEFTYDPRDPYTSTKISYGSITNRFDMNLTEIQSIEGPVTIHFSMDIPDAGLGKFIFKLNNEDTTPTPLNIISIPATNNGPMQLVIESSNDLYEWTPIYSGSAGTSGSAEFYRTRLLTSP